ncbi:MAG: PIN domain-containing protein [Clostridiales bacterium]|jgi:predicted nucleic acid-binding protein|nr:PIN domain-containing protein [Clostridiales bacterium]
MRKSLIDAGPLIALFDRDDAYHQVIKKFLKQYEGQLITTWPVVTEVLHMLDFHVGAQIDFLRWLQRDSITIHSLCKESISSIIYMTEKYADLPMDFADATLLVTSETTGIRNIITIDSDFFVYRTIRKEMLCHIFIPD